MLKMKQFDQIIKDKLKDFDAPENPAAWEEFSHKIPSGGKFSSGKIWISGLAGLLLIALITGSILLWENSKQNQPNQLKSDKIQISENSTNTSTNTISSDKVITGNNNQNPGVTENTIDNPINSSTQATLTNYVSTEKTTDLQEIPNINPGTKTDDNNQNQNNTTANNNQETSGNYTIENIVVNYNVLEICNPALVSFEIKQVPTNYTYCWNTGNNKVWNQAVVENYYPEPGNYSSSLEIYDPSGNMVKRVYLNDFTVYPSPKANISFENKNNLYTFSSLSENSLSTIWSVDNQVFTQSSLEYIFEKDGSYIVKLMVKNEAGCSDEAYKKIDIVIEHDYFVPNAFKPYSDGVNSTFGPIGENLFEYSFKMFIFDKTGTMIFETNNIDNLWNGKINGSGVMAEPGVYTWEIMTVDKYGTKKHKKGQVTLLKN